MIMQECFTKINAYSYHMVMADLLQYIKQSWLFTSASTCKWLVRYCDETFIHIQRCGYGSLL